MDSKFIAIVQQVVTDRGKAVTQNKAVFNSLLADYARGTFVRERRLFMRELSRKSYDEIMREAAPAPKPVPVPAPPISLPVPANNVPAPARVPASPSVVMLSVSDLKQHSMYELELPDKLYGIFEDAGFKSIFAVMVKSITLDEISKETFVDRIAPKFDAWLDSKHFAIDWDELMHRIQAYQNRQERRMAEPAAPARGNNSGDMLGAAAIGAAAGLGLAALIGLFS